MTFTGHLARANCAWELMPAWCQPHPRLAGGAFASMSGQFGGPPFGGESAWRATGIHRKARNQFL
jgi:hypothetical protein